MPGRWRVLIEVALVGALVLGGHLGVTRVPLAVALLLAEALVAIALLRPWDGSKRGAGERAAAVVFALLAVAAPALAEGPGRVGAQRRLGVELVAGEARAEDALPPGTTIGGIAQVSRVVPGTPAEGVVRVGDRIVLVNGEPLAKSDPAADLARTIQDDDLPEATTLGILRDGALANVPCRIPRASAMARPFGALSRLASDHLVVATALRDAVFVVFLLLLVRVDGQRLAALGIVRQGAGRELKAAFAATAGVFAVQIAGAIPLAAFKALSGLAEREAGHRLDTLGRLTGQGSGPEFLLALLVAASFEEIAFRAFLTPRLRTLTRSWIVAALLVSVGFGLGHVYEGTLAVFQTAMLGLYFTALFLARRRLLAVIVAHAAFNAVMFLAVALLAHSGGVQGLKGLGP